MLAPCRQPLPAQGVDTARSKHNQRGSCASAPALSTAAGRAPSRRWRSPQRQRWRLRRCLPGRCLGAAVRTLTCDVGTSPAKQLAESQHCWRSFRTCAAEPWSAGSYESRSNAVCAPLNIQPDVTLQVWEHICCGRFWTEAARPWPAGCWSRWLIPDSGGISGMLTVTVLQARARACRWHSRTRAAQT